MKAKTIAVGGLMALVALAMAAVIAANPFATQAASQDTPQSQVTSPEDLGNPQMADDEEASTNPYIGIYIAPGDDGGVMVLKVMKDSPSDGVLQADDLITAANSETVDGPNDLIGAVASRRGRRDSAAHHHPRRTEHGRHRNRRRAQGR